MTASDPVPGRVELRGLRCMGRHGTPPELTHLLVDIAADVDLGPAAHSDDLSQAVDVSALASTVREVTGGPPRALLETLACAGSFSKEA